MRNQLRDTLTTTTRSAARATVQLPPRQGTTLQVQLAPLRGPLGMTLTEVSHAAGYDDEMIVDARGRLTPSQLVDRKLQALTADSLSEASQG
ncbi:MAG: hypothetical protein SGJ20_18715 [Planctomycetota bacterium]|nr:hypothetical protein [Planctomycetota bacterium]